MQITENFFANFNLEKIRFLHFFLSIAEKGEIETVFIYENLANNYPLIQTIVPRVNFEKDRLEHLEFDTKTELVTNHWGISEPAGDKLISEKVIDLVLVPMLAFDERGFRVGHGKGFYDKFLSLCRPDCLKVGLSFFEPVEQIEDTHESDVPLDFCITPQGVRRFD